MSVTEIGFEKKMPSEPSESDIEFRNDCSVVPPRIRASIIGGSGISSLEKMYPPRANPMTRMKSKEL